MDYKKIVPLEKVVPFRQIMTIPTTTSTDSNVAILTVPAYNVVWVDVDLKIATSGVVCAVSTDSTYANVATISRQIPPGGDRIQRLVLGTPENVATSYGAHTITLTIRSAVSGQPGVVSGFLTVYGYRRG